MSARLALPQKGKRKKKKEDTTQVPLVSKQSVQLAPAPNIAPANSVVRQP